LIDISHLTGNQNVRAALKGFMRNDLLYRFHVTIGSFPGSITYKLGKFGPFKELRRRVFTHELAHKTKTSPWFEWFRLVIIKMGFQSMVQGDKNTFSVFSGYKYLDRKVASRLSPPSKEAAYSVKIKSKK
jgi:membrane protein YqaA with SNARE-associated domain